MDTLAARLLDARSRTLALVEDLDDAEWMGPRLAIVNPIRWEIGHLAWFQEFWVLRHARGEAPLHPGGDALYDSARVAHDTRWDLPLLDRRELRAYMETILARVLAVAPAAEDKTSYFHRLALDHEDMHGEALTYTRQTLAYHAPRFVRTRPPAEGAWPGDCEVQGARFLLGAPPGEGFVFDNEKWAHPVNVAPFRIARAPCTNLEFSAFVDAGGYDAERLWNGAGWAWRTAADARHPVYWKQSERGEWLERRYDSWRALAPHHPVIHVNAFEADAYCRWAKRRLPTESEWELAASGPEKRRFPWGDAPPHAGVANVDGHAGGPIDVAALPEGDSACGCRQMMGNVWEWTSSDFAPYPGFVVDPYAEYSQPWFATPHRVLRGGYWATRGRLLRNTWRNFYTPDRRDVLGGFRTCAL